MTLAVLNLVGLTPDLLPHAPRIRGFARGDVTPLVPPFPAVTCTVQSSILTGRGPQHHGVVANGWYDRDAAEVRFWQRSDRLVRGPKLWDAARERDPSFTVVNAFWWHNAYSSCDVELQVRPVYKADGRKLPDLYCNHDDWRHGLQRELGPFPLFDFWGPRAGLPSTRWIADAVLHTFERYRPTLTLAYLPHLDYDLQRLGPDHPDLAARVGELDAVVGELLEAFAAAGARVVLLSEYGVEATRERDAAVFVNRALRDAGHLTVRSEDGRDTLDPGGCRAFAVADHQAAHVYLHPAADPAERGVVETLCRGLDGVDARVRIDHPRAGDFTLVADRGRWFTYDFWRDEARAPDFARTVDIHRKPGYDPRELFSDKSPAAVALKLAKKKLGFRQLLDVVPLDPDVVRGTHGRTDLPPGRGPLLIGANAGPTARPMTDVHDLLLDLLTEIG